jgi:uncharacterized cupin superfamily protein
MRHCWYNAAMGFAHLDDARKHTDETPGVESTWSNLGAEADSVQIGFRRIEIPPGKRPTPPHNHHAEEEIFYVLGGDGLSWQDGTTYEVGTGDCIVHLPRAHAHTLRAGPSGLDVVVLGERRPTELCVLPRTGHGWLGDSWVEAGAGDSPWDRDAARGEPEFPPPSPRPANIVNVHDVAPHRWGDGSCSAERRDLGQAAGSVAVGLKHCRVEPGRLSAPPHCHSAEEELFLILDGSGTAIIGDEETPVRGGHVISRPAGSRRAHAFRAGDDGLVLLAFGQRIPDDMCWYPRSQKIYFRGLGVIGRVEELDYWDGEG